MVHKLNGGSALNNHYDNVFFFGHNADYTSAQVAGLIEGMGDATADVIDDLRYSLSVVVAADVLM